MKTAVQLIKKGIVPVKQSLMHMPFNHTNPRMDLLHPSP